MIVNKDSQFPIGYYDLEHNRVAVGGFSHSDNARCAKIITYPGVIPNMYSISIEGKVYSFINDKYISWSIRDNLPYINLSSIHGDYISMEPFFIRDLMAFSYISDAYSYLERGYRVLNIDGNNLNCNYQNIIYVQS